MAAEVLEVSNASASVTHFRPLNKTQVPQSFLRYLCNGSRSHEERTECLQNFNKYGAVWTGDVDSDGVDELIVDAGDGPGTEGPAWEIVQLKGKDWISLACMDPDDGCDPVWNSLHARFDILPITRGGYHDLRIEVDRCLKWDGHHYVDYAHNDYHRLKTAWFDVKNSQEAELFWKIRYSGKKVMQFEPLWFKVPAEVFSHPPGAYLGLPVRVLEFPKMTSETLPDPAQDLTWVSFHRAGVWGVRRDRAFLLVPRFSYLGATRMELHGDWLHVYGSPADSDTQPTIKYNRRTRELHFTYDDR